MRIPFQPAGRKQFAGIFVPLRLSDELIACIIIPGLWPHPYGLVHVLTMYWLEDEPPSSGIECACNRPKSSILYNITYVSMLEICTSFVHSNVLCSLCFRRNMPIIPTYKGAILY